jgi:nucleotide-binding universal stress UspA family protein
MENQLVTLLQITTPQLGSFVKDKLESEEIEVFFTNEGLTVGSEYDPNEILLKVKAGQSLKAVKILLDLHKDYDLNKVKDDASFKDLKRILVPVKLSSNCIELCIYAMNLAKKINAEVKVLYVYSDPRFNEAEKHTTSWEKHVRLELLEAFNKAQLRLVNFSKEFREQAPKELLESVKLHYRMLKGTPQNVISDACKRYHPHLVLTGTKESEKESGEFLGKTLNKVLAHLHYPVLAVPSSARFWKKEKINIMYSTNFYDTDNSSLNKLLEILQAFDKKIHCIHIDLHEDKHHQEKVDELNKMLKKEYSAHHIECKLFESENIVKGFDVFVAKYDIDIISMSKAKHSAIYKLFHTDLLVKLVSTEKVPILIFPV